MLIVETLVTIGIFEILIQNQMHKTCCNAV